MSYFLQCKILKNMTAKESYTLGTNFGKYLEDNISEEGTLLLTGEDVLNYLSDYQTNFIFKIYHIKSTYVINQFFWSYTYKRLGEKYQGIDTRYLLLNIPIQNINTFKEKATELDYELEIKDI